MRVKITKTTNFWESTPEGMKQLQVGQTLFEGDIFELSNNKITDKYSGKPFLIVDRISLFGERSKSYLPLDCFEEIKEATQ